MINKKLLVVAIINSVLLSGCGSDDEEKGGTQVAAKVDGKEITVHQLNQAFKSIRMPQNNSKVSKEEVTSKVLDTLINQEILLQQAKKMKLDRDPDILSAIEASKRKVLVDAYMQRFVATKDNINESEVREYFDKNKLLFTERKVFTYTQLLLPVVAEKQETMIKKVQELNDLNAFVEYLKKEEQKYKIVYETKATEKLSKPLIKPLYSIKPGDVGFLKLSDGLLVVKLNAVVDQAIDFKQAKPVIERALAVNYRKKSSMDLVKSLREQAKVEFVGDFKPVEDKKPVEDEKVIAK